MSEYREDAWKGLLSEEAYTVLDQKIRPSIEDAMRDEAKSRGLDLDGMSEEEKNVFEIEIINAWCKEARCNLYRKDMLNHLKFSCAELMRKLDYVEKIYYKADIENSNVVFIIVVTNSRKVLSKNVAKIEWKLYDEYPEWNISFDYIVESKLTDEIRVNYILSYISPNYGRKNE